MINYNVNISGVSLHNVSNTFSILKNMQHAMIDAAHGLARKYTTNQIDSSGHSNNKVVSSSHTAFIQKLESLRENTDFDTEKAVRDAHFFFENNFRKHGLSFPNVKLIDGKEVNFVIINDKLTLDVAIFGDHTFSYYIKFNDSEAELWDDSCITESLPSKVYELLRVK